MLSVLLVMQLAPAEGAPDRAPPSWTPPPVPGAPAPQPTRTPRPDREVTWFARMELGVGPRGFAENNALLEEVGYGGVKLWATLDGAWMFHRHVGAGIWLGMNRLSGQPAGNAPRLNEVAYFLGGQLPILLWGRRAYAFHATPRVAYAAGQLELDDGEDASFQNTVMFGGALSFQSFTYHIGGSIGFVHAPAGEPGELGRGHDYGGLYFTLGGTLDG